MRTEFILLSLFALAVMELEGAPRAQRKPLEIQRVLRKSNKVSEDHDELRLPSRTWSDVEVVKSEDANSAKVFEPVLRNSNEISNDLDGLRMRSKAEWSDVDFINGEGVAPGAKSAKIVGGESARPHSHPHQVSIQQFDTISLTWQHFCGGSIFKANKILTAAHCFLDHHDIALLRAVAGDHDIFEPEGTEQTSYFASVKTHPKYNSVTNDFDYAVVHLSKPFSLNGNVSRIALAPKGFVPSSTTTCVTTGWGSLRGDGADDDDPAQLQEVTLPFKTRKECVGIYAGLSKVTSRMLCAGGVGGQGICAGDSGGPLVCDGVLAGLTSWGAVPCGQSPYPGVFADVAAQRKWINSN